MAFGRAKLMRFNETCENTPRVGAGCLSAEYKRDQLKELYRSCKHLKDKGSIAAATKRVEQRHQTLSPAEKTIKALTEYKIAADKERELLHQECKSLVIQLKEVIGQLELIQQQTEQKQGKLEEENSRLRSENEQLAKEKTHLANELNSSVFFLSKQSIMFLDIIRVVEKKKDDFQKLQHQNLQRLMEEDNLIFHQRLQNMYVDSEKVLQSQVTNLKLEIESINSSHAALEMEYSTLTSENHRLAGLTKHLQDEIARFTKHGDTMKPPNTDPGCSRDKRNIKKRQELQKRRTSQTKDVLTGMQPTQTGSTIKPKKLDKPNIKKRTYRCTFSGCSNAYTSIGWLKAHQKRHTGEMAFKCETCGQRFPLLSSLTKHIHMHTGEKPFKC